MVAAAKLLLQRQLLKEMRAAEGSRISRVEIKRQASLSGLICRKQLRIVEEDRSRRCKEIEVFHCLKNRGREGDRWRSEQRSAPSEVLSNAGHRCRRAVAPLVAGGKTIDELGQVGSPGPVQGWLNFDTVV